MTPRYGTKLRMKVDDFLYRIWVDEFQVTDFLKRNWPTETSVSPMILTNLP
jgi:hypothetical protein